MDDDEYRDPQMVHMQIMRLGPSALRDLYYTLSIRGSGIIMEAVAERLQKPEFVDIWRNEAFACRHSQQL